MNHPGRVVKRRSYDATGRRERARLSHDRVVDAAEQRFLRDGYAATTIGAIAADAGVSVDTVYKTFGGKPGLISAILSRGLLGGGSEPIGERSIALQRSASDPRMIIRGWGELLIQVAPRTVPVELLLRDASATDPELQELQRDAELGRLRAMTANARRLHDAGHLRTDVTVEQAADILWAYSSPELFELLVLRRGMPLADYSRFISDAMIAALLPPKG